jgi:hypothetical protein
MGETKLPVDRHEIEEAVYLGRLRCQAAGCEGVDLSDVEDVNVAIGRWNEHVRQYHDE